VAQSIAAPGVRHDRGTPARLLPLAHLYGISDKIAFKPQSDEQIFGTDIVVKK
jgi:hypothetical protein